MQLLGAAELAPAQHMAAAAEAAPLSVSPAALQAEATLPINGDRRSCLEAPAVAAADGSASWQLRLDGSYPLLAVRLQAAAAAGPPSSSRLGISLLDAGGTVVATRQAPAAAAAASPGAGLAWELPAAVHAAAVRVDGWASLCDVSLLAADAEPAPVPSYRLSPALRRAAGGSGGDGLLQTQSEPQWTVADAATGQPAVDSSSGSINGSSSGGSGGPLFDGDPFTCVTAQAGPDGAAAALVVQLDRPVR